jgi:hypothetical protein
MKAGSTTHMPAANCRAWSCTQKFAESGTSTSQLGVPPPIHAPRARGFSPTPCALGDNQPAGLTSRPLLVGVAAVAPLVRPLVDVARSRPRVALAEGKQPQREHRLGSARCDELEHEPVRSRTRLTTQRQIELHAAWKPGAPGAFGLAWQPARGRALGFKASPSTLGSLPNRRALIEAVDLLLPHVGIELDRRVQPSAGSFCRQRSALSV